MSDDPLFRGDDITRKLNEIFPAPFPVWQYPNDMQPAIIKARRDAKFQRRANVLGNIVFYGAWLLFGAWVLAQVIDRTPPVFIEMKLLTPEVQPGDEIQFALKAKNKTRGCEVTVSWIVVDGHHEFKTFADDPVAPSDNGPLTEGPIRGFPTWGTAALGRGKIRVTRSYVCPGNYLHRQYPIRVSSPDVEFEFVGKRK